MAVVRLCLFAAFLTASMLPLTRGTAQADPSAAVVFPLLSPRVSSNFGPRVHPVYHSKRHHNGVDLAAPSRSHVRAIRGGKVVFAGTYGGYGKLISIEHDDGFVSMYGHLHELNVDLGDKVTSGQVIGRVGQTGTATGPHLHFEWRKDGKALNPLKVFPELAEKAEG